MVELPNGKMKSREGTVVDADDLIAAMIAEARQTSDELGKFKDMSEEEKQEIARIVGMGALKYFILKVDARNSIPRKVSTSTATQGLSFNIPTPAYAA